MIDALSYARHQINKDWHEVRHTVFANFSVKAYMLAVCFILNSSTYDKNKDGEIFDWKYNPLRHKLLSKMSFLLNWDGWYFFNTVTQGMYSSINQAAFFPGYPLIVKSMKPLIDTLPGFSDFFSDKGVKNITIVLSGVSLNFTLHIVNGLMLYALAKSRGLDTKTSVRAVYLFILNGTSLFHVTFYSESTYMFFSLLALLTISHRTTVSNNTMSSASILTYTAIIVCFAVSASIRSLGLLNFAYLGYPYVVELIQVMSSEKKEVQKQRIHKAVGLVVRVVVAVAVIAAPIFALAIHHRSLFCPNLSSSLTEENYSQTKVGTTPDFCFKRFGFFYSYVQEKFWGVRFLGQLRSGNPYVYLLTVNSLISVGCYIIDFINAYGLKIPTLFVGHYWKTTSNNDILTQDFANFCIMLLMAYNFFLFAHQNSIERFLVAHSYYHLTCSQLAGRRPWIKTLLAVNTIWRLFVTPVLFVTNIHPI